MEETPGRMLSALNDCQLNRTVQGLPAREADGAEETMSSLTPAVRIASSLDASSREIEAWFAVKTKPQYERLVGEALSSCGVGSFVPCYSLLHRWSDRLKKVEVPLFTGYLFGLFRWNQRNLLTMIPGCRGIVSFGGKPAPVDPHEMDNLRRIVESDAQREPHPYLRAGQPVRIIGGPLRGVEGFVSEQNDSFRVVVTISILQRSVGVQIDRDLVSVLMP
jgi:transcription antitermination factor NusG